MPVFYSLQFYQNFIRTSGFFGEKSMILDIDKINFNVSIEDCFKNLRPHPKFSHCSFDNYIPDNNFSSQHYIKETLINKVKYIEQEKPANNKKSFLNFFKKTTADNNKKINNLYIDGGYGVGKTHLLSACYNTANVPKAFLSFGELCYFFNYLGLENTTEHFSKLKLLLLDEFELDDPATTRMMAKFFLLINKNTLIITTSNTLPSDLGKMKFQVDEFAREMGIIAGSFKTVVVEGVDYRKRKKILNERIADKYFLEAFKNLEPQNKPKMIVDYDNLMATLVNNHPFKYFVIPSNIEAIFIRNLNPFKQLNNALRFAHLIDHCYYYNTKLFIRSDNQLTDFFDEEMLESCFSKKFYRCLSRLDELAVFFRN